MTDNIHLKKKVTLKKKQPDSQQPPTPPPTPEPPTGPSGSGKGKWIAAALAGLLVIGGGGYYLSQLDSNDNQATISTAVGSTESENGASAPAEVTVTLTDVGASKVKVIKAVREITGLGLVDAKKLVDNTPAKIKENVSADEGAKLKETLEAAGATVEVK